MASADRFDPTGGLIWEKKYEQAILPLIDSFGSRVVEDLVHAWDTGKIKALESGKFDPSKFYPHIDDLAEQEIIGPSQKIVDKTIPKAYDQGQVYASIQLGAPPEERKRQWTKIKTLLEDNKNEFKGESDEAARRIKRIIGDGIVNEKTQGQIIKDIQAEVEMSKTRATRIIRTESMRAVNAGVKDRYRQGGVEYVKWLACGDDRTCFPESTLVMTETGNKPIQSVQIGERVFTRGGLHKVVALHKRAYVKDFIKISARSGSVVCTSDHPIYIIGKGWLRADMVSIGHHLQTFEDIPSEVLGTEYITLSKPDHAPALTHQKPVLPCIDIPFVPIFSINLQDKFRGGNQEVNRIPSNPALLNERDTYRGQCKTDSLLNRSLARIFSITRKTAKPPLFLTGHSSEFLAAISTCCNHRGPSALFGTIFSILFAGCKHLPAPQTGPVYCVCQPTFSTTHSVPISNRGPNSEHLAADRANLVNSSCFKTAFVTLSGAIFSPSLSCGKILHKRLSAIRAYRRDLCYCGIVVTLSRTKSGFSGAGIKSLTTKFTKLLNGYPPVTEFGNIYHKRIGINTVYNLSVEGENEYYANNFLVHNCSACADLDGKIFPIDEVPDAPLHPGCRCTYTPVIRPPQEEPAPEPAAMTGEQVREKALAVAKKSDKERTALEQQLAKAKADSQALSNKHAQYMENYWTAKASGNADKIAYWTKEVQDVGKECDQYIKAAIDLQKQIDVVKGKQAKAVHDILYLRKNPVVNYNVSKTSAIYKKNRGNLDDGFEFFGRVVGDEKMWADPVKVNAAKTGRAFERNGEIFISSKSDSKTVTHELAHVLEERSGSVVAAEKAFYQARTKGDPLISLKKATGVHGYRANEVTRKDTFPDAYCGKQYPGDKNYELLSMGTEWLKSDPVWFAKTDPEYFAWTVDTLRGVL